jgi:hypothetical protein
MLTGGFESVLCHDLLLASYNSVDDKVLPDHRRQRLVRREQQMFAILNLVMMDSPNHYRGEVRRHNRNKNPAESFWHDGCVERIDNRHWIGRRYPSNRILVKRRECVGTTMNKNIADSVL